MSRERTLKRKESSKTGAKRKIFQQKEISRNERCQDSKLSRGRHVKRKGPQEKHMSRTRAKRKNCQEKVVSRKGDLKKENCEEKQVPRLPSVVNRKRRQENGISRFGAKKNGTSNKVKRRCQGKNGQQRDASSVEVRRLSSARILQWQKDSAKKWLNDCKQVAQFVSTKSRCSTDDASLLSFYCTSPKSVKSKPSLFIMSLLIPSEHQIGLNLLSPGVGRIVALDDLCWAVRHHRHTSAYDVTTTKHYETWP